MTPQEKAEKYATQDLNGIPLKSFDVEKAYLAGFRARDELAERDEELLRRAEALISLVTVNPKVTGYQSWLRDYAARKAGK